MPKLTPKQKKFVEAYDGNASEAARKAGYSTKNADQIGPRLVGKSHVAEAIAEREAIESRERIATRQERQALWTSIMYDESREDSIRLKASELLGKSEGDFLERREIVGPPEPPKITVHFISPGEDEGYT